MPSKAREDGRAQAKCKKVAEAVQGGLSARRATIHNGERKGQEGRNEQIKEEQTHKTGRGTNSNLGRSHKPPRNKNITKPSAKAPVGMEGL